MATFDKYLNTLPAEQVTEYKLLSDSDMTTFEKLLIVKLTAIEKRLEAIEDNIDTISTAIYNNATIPPI